MAIYSISTVAKILRMPAYRIRQLSLLGAFPFIFVLKGKDNKNNKYIVDPLEFELYLKRCCREDLIIADNEKKREADGGYNKSI